LVVAQHHCLDYHVAPGLKAADRAIAAAQGASDAHTEGLAKGLRSELLNLAGRHDEALLDARCALQLATPKERSAAHGRLALALFHAGQPADALAEIRTAIATEFLEVPVSATMLNHFITTTRLLESGEGDLCSRVGAVAELLLEIARSDIGGLDERVALEDALPHRRLVATLVDVRLRSGQVASALATVDRHRARSLAEEDANVQRNPGEGVRFVLPQPTATLSELIDATEAAAHAALSAWGIPRPPDEATLARLVDVHERTIVLFHPTDTKVIAFVARPGVPPRAFVVSDSAKAVLRMTGSLERILGIVIAAQVARGQLPHQSLQAISLALSVADDELDRADARLDELRRSLHDALFGRLEEVLSDQEPLAIVPYRELSVLPIGVLIRSDGTTLADHHPLSVLPSIASLGALAERQGARPRAVVVGDPRVPANLGLDPLPGAAKEAHAIAKLLRAHGTQTKVLCGRRATEASVRRAADGAAIVHFGCHAAVREPVSASALFLTPSTDDDGKLLPAEAADLQLDGALVVLSACQSGTGHVTADGVIGLSRAFVRSGARAVLASLWLVEDEATSVLMEELYKGLAGRGTKRNGRRLDVAAAVQRAQLLTRERFESRTAAWGPWVLIGDGGWHVH
jgi:CHAT domain-containing protein